MTSMDPVYYLLLTLHSLLDINVAGTFHFHHLLSSLLGFVML